jgi:hypothetical protein
MSNLNKLKIGKFVATIAILSSISAIFSSMQKAEAFPINSIMPPGSSVRSNNQCFSLNAQADGNLVLYKKSNGQALWDTKTYGRNVKQTIFQTDGNLVIYNTSNQPVWASNTDRRGATQLNVQDDGNVVMYNGQNQAIWATNTVTSCGNNTPPPPPRPANSLINNTTMPPGSSIQSNNQCFSLNAQNDGNLVLYRKSNGQALWDTKTYGRNVKQTIFQTDGNLVIYNTSNQSVWASNTDRRNANRVTVQDDGNLVMYNAQNQAIWATNTVTSCNPPTPTPPPPPQYTTPTSKAQADKYFKTQFYNAQWNPDGPGASNNCGPTSVAMIFKLFGKEPGNLSVQGSINYARQMMNVAPSWTGYTSDTQMMTGLANAGLRATNRMSNGTWSQLDQDLAAGKAIIAWGYYAPNWRYQFPSYSSTGNGYTNHINTILGKTPNGNYLVGDPMYRGGVVEMNRNQLAVFFSYGGGGHDGNPYFISVSR